ncbi:unnamed protein product [Gongylonema pulchrum]|uniref:BRCT domain-containing protein n=1 Tax=Gongylonema pulchrum TaxID=637853 RepID=A0A3P6QM57_9BILA|nr:unnamed protein product [Gongylonema pulchrum]
MVNNCTIVSQSWLNECIQRKALVPTADFEVTLKIDDSLVNISTQRALLNPCTLFTGTVFYVPETYFKTRLVTREVFLEIIELSGGKFVKYVWNLVGERSYIIFAPDCLDHDAARRIE